MQHTSASFYQLWSRISITGLWILSIVGGLLRYKISYSLPQVDHKNLLSSHSHFAFAGWVSVFLYTIIFFHVVTGSQKFNRTIHWLLWNYLMSSFAMLFLFPFMGYNVYTIIFSTLNILFTFVFAAIFWTSRECKNLDRSVRLTLNAAMFFQVFSSLGPFVLAYLMAAHQQGQLARLSVYHFLHFSYNGWFSLAIAGIFLHGILGYNLPESGKQIAKGIFWIACAILPGYFLSMLWMNIPAWIYTLAFIAVVLQSYGWFLILREIIRIPWKNYVSNPTVRLLWILSASALTIKFLLQAGSLLPVLNKFAFAYRPIVIGYLHLVLLGFITLFLLGKIMLTNGTHYSSAGKRMGLFLFLLCLVFTEILLMLQGMTMIWFWHLPWIPAWLFTMAAGMFLGLTLLVLSPRGKSTASPDDLPVLNRALKYFV